MQIHLLRWHPTCFSEKREVEPVLGCLNPQQAGSFSWDGTRRRGTNGAEASNGVAKELLDLQPEVGMGLGDFVAGC